MFTSCGRLADEKIKTVSVLRKHEFESSSELLGKIFYYVLELHDSFFWTG